MVKDIHGNNGRVWPAHFYHSERGNYLCVDGYFFLRNSISQHSISWRCSCYRSFKCKARARTDYLKPDLAVFFAEHSHSRSEQKSIRRQNLIRVPLTKSLTKMSEH